MKTNHLIWVFLVWTVCSFSQYQFEPSAEHPYGLPNPEAPQQVLDFMPLIGECNCKSVSRKADQTWAEPIDMVWRFKYIMNGMAVQDETLKADGKHSGSIRQFIPDSTRWYVHYYSSGAPSVQLPVWEGTKNKEGNIVLYREQKAPNGVDGFYRLSFSEMSTKGFKWVGEWVSKDETITYPTWKIDCLRNQNAAINTIEKEKILEASKKFSEAYIRKDYDTMASAYTSDAKLFPLNTDIIIGTAAIKKRWMQGTSQILEHQMKPEEVNFMGNYAYDYGYYQGISKAEDGTKTPFKGKYVVVWKKVEDDWKMYLDIWNRLAN